MFFINIFTSLSLLVCIARAHVAAWHPSMYCFHGSNGRNDENTNDAVNPLYKLPKELWWFHRVNLCDLFEPAPGEFLELPAGGSFTVELANNRGQTTFSYGGAYTSDWPDGQDHPEDYNLPNCITQPNLHTQNQSMAAGTAFAISYVSDIYDVTPSNLVVFSVRHHTPWKRLTTYDVPAALPTCPPDGCICAWGWVPNGCGQPNMYMEGFRCKVTGASGIAPVASAKPPVWCEDDQRNCTQGAKQMIFWNQLDGNNIHVKGQDMSGMPKSPAYNDKCGFRDGAQNDIFVSC